MSETRVKLSQLNIVSRDPAASIAFYRRLGMDIPEERVWSTSSGPHHISALEAGTPAGMDFDLDSVVFAGLWNGGWRGRTDLGGKLVVGFSVASRIMVDEIYGEMTTAEYAGLQSPYDAFWGSRYAVIEDPDGIAVGLMSPRSDDKRSPPPDV